MTGSRVNRLALSTSDNGMVDDLSLDYIYSENSVCYNLIERHCASFLSRKERKYANKVCG